MEKFLNKLAEDENLRSEFLKQTTPEGAYKVAKPYIGSMTMEEFATKLVNLANIQKKVEDGELSEDELNTVAGGFSLTGVLGKISEFAGQVNPQTVAGLASGVESTASDLAGGVESTVQGVSSVWSALKSPFSGSKSK